MRLAAHLGPANLAEIVAEIQSLLWQTPDAAGNLVWDLDKEWDAETVEYIAAILEDHGLRPGPRTEPELPAPAAIVPRGTS